MPEPSTECGRKSQEQNQIEGMGKSRTSVSEPQTGLWLQQGSLPWFGQECYPTVCDMWVGEFVHGSTTIAATYIGDVRLKFAVEP